MQRKRSRVLPRFDAHAAGFVEPQREAKSVKREQDRVAKRRAAKPMDFDAGPQTLVLDARGEIVAALHGDDDADLPVLQVAEGCSGGRSGCVDQGGLSSY